ncbi:MAG TPA: hypothetical protein H9826_09980, partial [Candidatus Intestinimonas merdavium]|nr:hypothetical protein [Candidatus Intestinimonas merdavium]
GQSTGFLHPFLMCAKRRACGFLQTLHHGCAKSVLLLSFCGGAFTSQGYISYHGTLTMEELMMEDPAEQYQKEQEEIAGMEMS